MYERQILGNRLDKAEEEWRFLESIGVDAIIEIDFDGDHVAVSSCALDYIGWDAMKNPLTALQAIEYTEFLVNCHKSSLRLKRYE